jgi:hypothetical protein
MGDFGCAFFSEFVEEHTQRSLAAARSGPDETPGVVVNNNDQIAVSTFIGDLIDPDPPSNPQDDPPSLRHHC